MEQQISVKDHIKEYTRHVWQTDSETAYSEKIKLFTLQSKRMTYALAVLEEGHICHLYFGKKVVDDDLSYLLRLDENPWTLKTNRRDQGTIMDTLPFEYPCHGTGDYREPCFKILDKDGMSACDIRYKSYQIYEGKPKLSGLPATFAKENEAETLELVCQDKHSGFLVTLLYTVYKEVDVVTRSVIVENIGDQAVNISRVLSMCVEFDHDELDLVTLNGSWGRERMMERSRLHHGKQGIDSVKGVSSHQNNPFFALVSPYANEDVGEAYGFNLVYSGNFFAQAEVTQHKKTRAVLGMNHFDFNWRLEAGEIFTAPEAVMVYSDRGIGQMSRTFHDLYRNHLIRRQKMERPILINNWEATYFDFDTEKLLEIARQAARSGIEMLVMDDGWFGQRDSDNSSLGDWVVYEKKISAGLRYLVDEVNKLGLKFGIWFEPEMVSPDSVLFKAHPDWAIQIKGREKTLSREQYVLDFSRREVRDYIYAMMKKILDSANIEYIKWDMNRQFTEVGSLALPADRQRELWHRHMLGVYEMLEKLTTDYPHILLESCSGGGGRFDAGMLYYSPQIWCSDNTDAIERLKIQHGTSLCYPVSAIGSHVSDCPNHTVGRVTPFQTRGHVAMAGTFGYELDVTKISEEERGMIAGQIEAFKKHHHLMKDGDQYRIGNVFADQMWDAWMFVAKDKSEALFTFVQVLGRANYRSRRVKLKGLDPERGYRNMQTGVVQSGAALMNAGVNVGLHGDFRSEQVYFVAV